VPVTFANRNIYVDEGPRALFKGLGPTLIGVVPARYAYTNTTSAFAKEPRLNPHSRHRAINFSTYANSKTLLAHYFPNAAVPPDIPIPATGNHAESSPYIHLGAAAIAGEDSRWNAFDGFREAELARHVDDEIGVVTATATNPIWGEFSRFL
jgi:hypothetical protein